MKLYRDLASVKKELENVNDQNASLRWKRNIVDTKVRVLERDAGVTFIAVGESPEQNVAQVAHSVEAVCSKHRERLTEQGGWKLAQIRNVLKTSVSHPDASVHCEIARCTEVLSNHVNAVMAASLETLPVLRTGLCVETRKGDGYVKDANSGADSRSVGHSSS